MKRHRTVRHHLSETTLGNSGIAAWEMMHMEDKFKVWTTVGSAGTLDHTDLAKVTLHQSVIQLGAELLPPPPVAHNAATAGLFSAAVPTQQAVVRYNVTPVDGMFPSVTPAFAWALRLRYRGRVTARWIEVDLATGTETQLVQFDSNAFPAAQSFQVQAAFHGVSPGGFREEGVLRRGDPRRAAVDRRSPGRDLDRQAERRTTHRVLIGKDRPAAATSRARYVESWDT